jgi:hypothetical protein
MFRSIMIGTSVLCTLSFPAFAGQLWLECKLQNSFRHSSFNLYFVIDTDTGELHSYNKDKNDFINLGNVTADSDTIRGSFFWIPFSIDRHNGHYEDDDHDDGVCEKINPMSQLPTKKF